MLKLAKDSPKWSIWTPKLTLTAKYHSKTTFLSHKTELNDIEFENKVKLQFAHLVLIYRISSNKPPVGLISFSEFWSGFSKLNVSFYYEIIVFSCWNIACLKCPIEIFHFGPLLPILPPPLIILGDFDY